MHTPSLQARSLAAPAEPDGRWRALTGLALTMLLAMAPWFSTAAVLPQLRNEWRLSLSQGAWLTIAVPLGFVLGALASALANLADLIAPRWLLLAGALVAAIANAGLIFCQSFLPAVLLRLATGACLALVYPPGLKLMATWFRRQRGTALGVMVGALTFGSALPHLMNALGGAHWRGVILTTSAVTALGGLLGAACGGEGPFPFDRARFDPAQLARAFRNRGVRWASLAYFGHMWELYAMWSWIGLFLAGRLSRRSASFAAFAVIVAGAAGCALTGWYSDWKGRAPAAALAMWISGSCCLTLGWMTHLPISAIMAVALLWGFTVVADSAQFSVLVTEYADPRYAGTALTAQLGIGFTLALVTIWLIPLIRIRLGWGWAFCVLAPGPALGLLSLRRLPTER